MTEQDFFADSPATEQEQQPPAITVIPKETEIEVIEQTKPIVTMAEALMVTNQSEQVFASNKLKEIKKSQKSAKEKLDPICDSAHKAWKANTGLRSELLEPFQEAERIIKSKIVTFLDAEEAKAHKIQMEAEAKAKREEEKERQKLQERARNWEEKGNTEKAEVLLDQAEEVFIAPEVIKPAVEKVSGVSSSKAWKWRIIDINLLPREYLVVNEKALNAIVKAMKENTNIPGIQAYSERKISAGS